MKPKNKFNGIKYSYKTLALLKKFFLLFFEQIHISNAFVNFSWAVIMFNSYKLNRPL